MKNRVLSLAAVALLASCSTTDQLVRQSDICISNSVGSKIWFRDCERAQIVARAWHDGVFGPAEVTVLDSAAWTRLEKQLAVHN